MDQKLPIIKTFKDSFINIKNDYSYAVYFIVLTTIYYVLRKSIYFMLGYFDIDLDIKAINYSVYFLLISLKYILIYFLVRGYFDKKPLWVSKNFLETLKKAAAIFILYMAIFGILIIFFALMKKAFIPEFITNFLASDTGMKLIFILAYIFSIFILVIPSFAWVSSAIGEDSSITSSFFKVNGNYIRIVVVFMLMYFGVEFVRYIFNESFDAIRQYLFLKDKLADYYNIIKLFSMGTNLVLSIVFLFVEFFVFFQVYKFFYSEIKKWHQKSNLTKT